MQIKRFKCASKVEPLRIMTDTCIICGRGIIVPRALEALCGSGITFQCIVPGFSRSHQLLRYASFGHSNHKTTHTYIYIFQNFVCRKVIYGGARNFSLRVIGAIGEIPCRHSGAIFLHTRSYIIIGRGYKRAAYCAFRSLTSKKVIELVMKGMSRAMSET